MLISFKQYLGMLCVGPWLLSLGLALTTGLGAYPSGDCKNISVDPEAVKLFDMPAETPVALCRKGNVNTLNK